VSLEVNMRRYARERLSVLRLHPGTGESRPFHRPGTLSLVGSAVASCLCALIACGDDATTSSSSGGSSTSSTSSSSGGSSTSSTSSSSGGSSTSGGSSSSSGAVDSGTPAIVVTAPSFLTTTEDLGTSTFTVALATKPTVDVTVTLSIDKADEAGLDKTTLTFTPANFATAQTVTITGKDDDVDDGDVAYKVVFGAATSTDSGYSGKKPADIALTNIDNDTAGLTISAPSGLKTTEKGGTVTFTVRLKTKPTADVAVPIVSDKVAEAMVSAPSLTFTTANYATPQTVTVTGVNDFLPDGDVTFSVKLGKSTSVDAKYVDLEGKVDLSNTDDDRVAAMAAFFGGYCVQFVDGRGKCWGQNISGVLGQGNTANRGAAANQMGDNMPFLDLGLGRTITTLSTSNMAQFMCAILDNGALKCWGDNQAGVLGLGDTASRGGIAGQMGDNLPAVNLGANRTAKQVAIGYIHACAVLDNNTVKCWGFNSEGQLGLGDRANRGDDANEMGDNLPTVNLGANRTAKQVAAGRLHTCAVLDDDTVKCWGNGVNGALGLGWMDSRGDNANEMGDKLPAVDLGTNRTAKSIGLGSNHSCAWLDNNTVKCWGSGADGQLGQGNTASRGNNANQMGNNLPAIDFGANRTVAALSVGHSSNCVILDDGTTKCWGQNVYGQLGRGHQINLGSATGQMGNNLGTADFGGGLTAKTVYAGTFSFCAVLNDGAVKCWGLNSGGTLGLGDQHNRGDQVNEMGDALPAVKLVGP
jgi:alpha-tubulin suppressor-like RCC1 family protein